MSDEQDKELEFVEKPIRKPDARIYGRLERWSDSEFQQFVPVAHGTGTKREVMKSAGRAKLVKNEGEKTSSYTLLANVDASDQQFAETLIDDTVKLLKPFVKKEVKIPSARFIVDGEAIKIWKSKERKKICVHLEMDASSTLAMLSQTWSHLSCEVIKYLMNSKLIKQ